MHTNETKKRLQAGETVLGCWFRYADPSLVEFAGYQGWDFVVFDGEHGTLEPRDCEAVVRAAELRGVTPIVRVTTNAPHVILRYMDAGAQGAHIPLVNSGAEAEAAVASMKYGPVGTRGLGAVRAAAFGQERPLGEYAEQANRETLVIAQIETAAAVDALPAIVAVDGVDVIFLGLSDLSNSLGVPGQTGHPDVERAAERVVQTATASSCALGVLVGNAEAAVAWRDRGARYIAVTLEGLIVGSSREYLAAVRS